MMFADLHTNSEKSSPIIDLSVSKRTTVRARARARAIARAGDSLICLCSSSPG